MQPVSTRIVSPGARSAPQCAAGMNKRPSVALQTLHDKTFTTEQPNAELPLKRDTDTHALGGSKKRILLAISSPPISERCTAIIFPG